MAKCKNRHLVEIARTLLLHHKVLNVFFFFFFWEGGGGGGGGVCYLSCLLLINRMSSSVFHDQIPHSILFSNQPLFRLPPRVFVCVFSWVILDFKEVIDVILPTQISTSSLLMSLSLRVPLSSHLRSVLMF